MSLLLEVKSAEHIDAEENIHDRKISTSFLKWANGAVLGWDYTESRYCPTETKMKDKS